MRRSKTRLVGCMLVFTVWMAGAVFATDEPVQAGMESESLPPAQVVHVHLTGALTELPLADPFELSGTQVMTHGKLIDKLNKIRQDPEVDALVLTFDRMSFGMAQMQEIRHALGLFQEEGKPIYVHAEGMNTLVYALLCSADDLSVAPQSTLWLTGLYGEEIYVKGLLDKIGIQGDFMHTGDYKSAAETLTRTGPSDAARENVDWLLDSLYGSLIEMIAESRQTTPDQVRQWIDEGPYLAQEALDKGLIDAVETREAFLSRVKEAMGGKARFNNRYGQPKRASVNMSNPFALFSLFSEMFSAPPVQQRKDEIAVVYVDGAILPGYGQSGLLGPGSGAYSGDIGKALETAAKDKAVKAVVMRVNSPGGSAEASEVILNAARQVQAAKPFVVSMGNVAGSGGYYISCAADVIYADASTVTASIGVVGGKLVTQDMWDKLGITWAEYQRGAHANLLTDARPFDPDERALFQQYMDQIYEVFKGHVSKGRGYRLRKPLEEIAGGRVYTGKQALKLGLVDYLGGLDEAVACAAKKASLEDYNVRVIPEPKDFLTLWMDQYSGQGDRPADIRLDLPLHYLTGQPNQQALFELLKKAEPQRARVLLQALRRIELIRQEGVIMMMPHDLLLN